MIFIGWMRFAVGQHPITIVYCGEKGVCKLKRMMYACEIKFVSQTDSLFIDSSAPDDKNLVFMLMPANRRAQLIVCLATGK